MTLARQSLRSSTTKVSTNATRQIHLSKEPTWWKQATDPWLTSNVNRQTKKIHKYELFCHFVYESGETGYTKKMCILWALLYVFLKVQFEIVSYRISISSFMFSYCVWDQFYRKYIRNIFCDSVDDIDVAIIFPFFTQLCHVTRQISSSWKTSVASTSRQDPWNTHLFKPLALRDLFGTPLPTPNRSNNLVRFLEKNTVSLKMLIYNVIWGKYQLALHSHTSGDS